jgi:energy-coupling factor transporter ATP-binding protein EcfA2
MTNRQKKENTPSDEGVIIGKGNVFSGPIKVGRDFIAGDQINITRVMKAVPFQPPASLEDLRNSYLAHLQASFRALDFKGIPQLDTFSRELLLEDVYIPLLARPERPDAGETWQRPRLAGRLLDQNDLSGEMLAGMKAEPVLPVKVEEALAKHKRVVVLGDPGSGKSTLLKYLSLRLAAEPNAPLPIPVPLNAYADAQKKGTDTSLQRFLSDYYASRSCQTEALGPLFDAALQKGQAVVLLDGLDEVQTRSRRLLIERIEIFAAWAAGKNNRVLVTSRIVGYGESPLSGRDWQLFTLVDFDRQAIEAFAARWCLAFEKSTLGDNPEAAASAERERRSLLEALELNPGVAQLASNPLLLTILALIKRQGVSLPNRRVELYELYLKTLITSWSKARALDKRPVGPEMDYLKTIAVLAPLALWLREENPSAGLVSEERLVEWLTSFYQGEEYEYKRDEAADRARDFLNSVRTYSNLLIERGQGRYGFIHLTFEEMLAARALVQKGQLKLEDSLAEIRRRVADPAWRETLLLAVGIWGVVHGQPQVAAEVVRAMLKMDCEGEWVCRNVLLAGACLEDVGESGVGRKAASEIREALLSACRNRGLPPAVQRDAGFCLGRTGWVPPDLNDMISIPAGKFL